VTQRVEVRSGAAAPLDLLNEVLGLEVPIVIAMYCKAALTAHPAYRPNIRRLQQAGVTILRASTR
jgi:hypothetical protein